MSHRATLTACRHILAETCSPMSDQEGGSDLIPEMLKGGVQQSSVLRHGSQDLSGFHTAVLWAGSTIVAVGGPLLTSVSVSVGIQRPRTSFLKRFHLWKTRCISMRTFLGQKGSTVAQGLSTDEG